MGRQLDGCNLYVFGLAVLCFTITTDRVSYGETKFVNCGMGGLLWRASCFIRRLLHGSAKGSHE